MYWFDGKRIARSLLAAGWLALAGTAAADRGDFVLGGGVEADSEDGLAIAFLGDVEVLRDTWLSASTSFSSIELPRGGEVDNLYFDVGLDHFFDPVGLRAGVAYSGDESLLESLSYRGAVYSRSDNASFAINGEFRDFDFFIPPRDLAPATTIGFDASGFGVSAKIDAGKAVSLRASGMQYNYSREFRFADRDIFLDLLAFTRLSVLSSLVDWRAGAGIDVDIGRRQLSFDVSRWKGIVDRSDNVGATVSFLTPVSSRADLELSLGFDDSDLYGDVTFLSVFLFFYGGD